MCKDVGIEQAGRGLLHGGIRLEKETNLCVNVCVSNILEYIHISRGPLIDET